MMLFAEELNTKILTPDLSEKDLLQLHDELQQLYRMYIAPGAVDTLAFDEDIVTQMQTSRHTSQRWLAGLQLHTLQ